ncbi:hypothetical protein AJ88_46630 [Mesorhizobium amorphae CCBAU 01583]|nr:hypothetical protein AJ88_46630 [Mesorhizobium amorphae CCBAU 01583]
MTSDLEAARASWRNDVEFNGNVGLGVINADAAYAMGFTGKDANIGFIDQPVWAAHPEFAGRLTFLPTSGTRVYTDPYIPVEAGDPFAPTAGSTSTAWTLFRRTGPMWRA